jgi:hypothetical protein
MSICPALPPEQRIPEKASAVARLAGQYLKAHGAGELRRENQALKRRLAATEGRVAELEARLAAVEWRPALPNPEDAVPPAAALNSVTEQERRPASFALPNEGWAEIEGGKPLAARPALSDPHSSAGAVGGRENVPP